LVGDELVLDCYRLAKFYNQSPAVFLEMGMSEVRIHLERTIDLSNIMRAAASDDG
jgi:hypothetical protein